ncbi:MAG TPA: VTT domain-containing protein [Acidobacteriota bacterium]|jgi:membrane protein DedA with SNARE-associated domain|nr:VTT domain-containing protein [Acidobacteriota bacterium]
MKEILDLFHSHGALILFVAVWLDNMGVPIPSFPFLLAAGALATTGRPSLGLGFMLATIAALSADVIWYYLGKFSGRRILRWICLISLNPESCVSKTEEKFMRYGLRSLFIAKYVPGLNTIAPPLSGLLNIPVWKFLAYDLVGCMFWSVPLLLIGFLFSKQLGGLALFAERFGNLALVVVLIGVAAFVIFKIYERRKFYRHLRSVRISPDELHAKIKNGEKIAIIDLRSPLAFDTDPFSIPSSIRIVPDELEVRVSELPAGVELILYCT